MRLAESYVRERTTLFETLSPPFLSLRRWNVPTPRAISPRIRREVDRIRCFLAEALEISLFYRSHKFLFSTNFRYARSKSMRWTKNFTLAKFAVLTADVHGHPLYVPGGKAGHQDEQSLPYRGRDRFCQSVACVCAVVDKRSVRPPSANDAIVHHMEELERQVKELRAEVATLKEKDSDKPASATPVSAPAQSNAGEQRSARRTRRRLRLPLLAGLLGPTTLSGFVDVYYGQNFNNPASQTNGLRFFDGGTNQFGLNLVELVVDKTPEVIQQSHRLPRGLGFRAGHERREWLRSRRSGLRSVFEGSLLLLSGARGQGAAGGCRKVRYAAWSGSHRDQGQLELLSRTALLLCHSLLPLRNAGEVCLQ